MQIQKYGTVLYVEDDKQILKILTEFLSRRFNIVISAQNGEEGLSKFLDSKPDIVITDIRMPMVNGVEMIHSIRKVDHDIPIVVLSAYADEDFLTDSIKNLINGQVAKPVDEDTFDRVIKNCLAKVQDNTSVETVLKRTQTVSPLNENDCVVREDSDKELIFVGIGASAGGLEALDALVAGLPLKNHSAYIIAQHLSPNHKTMLVDLLSKVTQLPVQNASHNLLIEPDVIYITPSNKNIEISREGRILLSDPDKHSLLPKQLVNQLFISLAKNQKESSIGIILSGTGSDGAQGMRAISAAGGITMVQNPASAKYDGMPKAAIGGCNVYMILECEQIGHELVALANFPREKVLQKYQSHISKDELSVIFDLLFHFKKVDFSVYKKTTINRRIERRMLALKVASLSEYVTCLENDHNEVSMLYQDILIGVTRFFRDATAFDSLKQTLTGYLDQNSDLKEFRIWVPGISTGEEVYSVLICLKEVMKEKEIDIPIRLFATDIDENAIRLARKGVYSGSSLAEVSESIINKYFSFKDTEFEVSASLKEPVVFSFHNLIEDPPFKNIDLIVCRNLLIYFTLEAQQQVMSSLHYALKDLGILFLGKSENITNYENLFATVSHKAQIYRRVPVIGQIQYQSFPGSPMLKRQLNDIQQEQAVKSTHLHEEVIEEAVKLLLPNLIVINEQFDIVYKKGKLDFLSFQDGYISYNLFKMVDARLAIDLRKALVKAKETNAVQASPFIRFSADNFFKICIVPLNHKLQNLYILYFQHIKDSDFPQVFYSESDGISKYDHQIELELQRTREHMYTLVEKLETSNEELQSTNEELQSSNEELQSTNEEMETSNEELQATNEELHTAYAELKQLYDSNTEVKEELVATNERYEKILDSLNDAVTVSTINGTLVRTNRAMQELTGISKVALLAKTWSEIVDSEEISLETRTQHLLSKGYFGPYTYRIFNAEGRLCILNVKDYLIEDQMKRQLIWSFATDITAELEATNTLKQNELKYRTIFNTANIGIAKVLLNGVIKEVNTSLCRFLKYTEKELISLTVQQITHPEDLDKNFDLTRNVMNGQRVDDKIELRYFNSLGSIVWGRLSVSLIRDTDNRPDYFVISIEDIDDIKQTMRSLEQAQVVFNATQEAILVTDNKAIITSVNDAFEHITGFTPDEVIGENVSLLQSDKHPKSFYEEMSRLIKQRGIWSGEVINKKKHGEYYPTFLNVTSVKDNLGHVIQYVSVLTDISLIKESQKKIDYLANHDTLTGLPNRALFKDRLEHAMEKAKRVNSHLAILFIDLDRFKIINDGLGHHVGDEVLIEISKRFKQTLRQQDTIARLGGDEFVVILDDLSSPINAAKVAEALILQAGKPIHCEQHSVQAGCSIGISLYPNDGYTAGELLRLADIAMYEAKDSGRNTYRFTSEELSTYAFEKVTLENSIREGLVNGQFELFYQPIVELDSMDIVHAEALIRWNHPQLGLVMPGKFIPLAEESNLIVSITEFVVFEAFQAVKIFEKLAGRPLNVSINFSSKDFESTDLYIKFKSYLNQTQIKASSIIMELTERMFVKSDVSQQKLFQRYEDLGAEIAIDDFGTGYSNLNSLSGMKVDYLKIDRSFVEGIGRDKPSEELVKATIAIANALGLKTIAEGIETQEQLDFLREHGCGLGQGYFLYMPASLSDMKELLK